MSLSKEEVLILPISKINKYITKINKQTIFDCLVKKPIIFSQLKDHDLYKDEEFIIEVSKLNPLIIAYISLKLKQNLNFMLELSKIPNTVEYCYKYASDRIKLNTEFKMNLINNDVEKTIDLNIPRFYNNWELIRHGLLKSDKVFTLVPLDTEDNIELIKQLLMINPFIIQYLSIKLRQNLEIISIVLYKDGLTLQYLPKIYYNYINIAIKSNIKTIDYLKTLNYYDQIYSRFKDIVNINYNVRLFLNNTKTNKTNNEHIDKKQKLNNNHKQNILKRLFVCDYYFELKFNRMIIDYLLKDVNRLKQHEFINYKETLSIIDNYN